MDGFDALVKKLSFEEAEAWAAVAIILRETGYGLETLLVKRAVVPGDPWSGDMAFPGGKKSPEDVTLRSTVHREVLEETGIDLNNAYLLGTMPTVFSALRSEMSVLPILYRWEGEPKIKLNSELTKYVWVKLEDLSYSRRVEVVKGWRGSVFRIGDDVIWGLTYRILEKLIEFTRV